MTAATIETVMRGDLGNRLDDLPAPLDVDCRATTTPRAFLNRLSYMHKELDLLKPYRAVAARFGPEGDLTALNRQLGQFLRHFVDETHRRRQTGSTGVLHPRSPGYFGTPPRIFRRSSGESSATRDARDRHFDRVGRLVRAYAQEDEES